MLEKKIENLVWHYAESKGVMQRKFVSPAHIGVPDRLFIYRGITFFIEFKQSGKTMTPAQLRESLAIRKAGAAVFTVDDVTEGKMLIDLLVRRIDSFFDEMGLEAFPLAPVEVEA